MTIRPLSLSSSANQEPATTAQPPLRKDSSEALHRRELTCQWPLCSWLVSLSTMFWIYVVPTTDSIHAFYNTVPLHHVYILPFHYPLLYWDDGHMSYLLCLSVMSRAQSNVSSTCWFFLPLCISRVSITGSYGSCSFACLFVFKPNSSFCDGCSIQGSTFLHACQ